MHGEAVKLLLFLKHIKWQQGFVCGLRNVVNCKLFQYL